MSTPAAGAAGRVWPTSLVLAGAGKMGAAMLRGWLAGGLAADAVRLLDPHLAPDVAAFCRDSGISLDPPDAAPEALVLAFKPQTFAAAASAMAALAQRQTLVVSILAGKTLAGLRAGLPDAGAIVRAMPNLPASIGHGISGLAAEAGTLPARRAVAQTLLASVGEVEWLDETLLDAVTAVSGSGPAYLFHLVECLAAAGVAAGLPADVAERLARATVQGSGALMAQRPEERPAALRAAVTSPGGTTAAALDVLGAEGGLQLLMTRAVAAAVRRAGELAG